MYKKSPQGWLKHWDFMLIDMICLQLAFIAAFLMRHGWSNPYAEVVYRSEAVAMLVCQLVVTFLMDSFRDVLKRGYYVECTAVVRHVLIVMLLSNFYLFVTKDTSVYSRLTFVMTGIFYSILTYLARIGWKQLLRSRFQAKREKRSLIVVTVSSIAEEVLQNISSGRYQEYQVAGLILVDQDRVGKQIHGIPVVGNIETAADYICREWVDEVFVHLPQELPLPEELMSALVSMGVTVHLSLSKASEISGKKPYVEQIGSYTVLTTSVNFITPKQYLYKRLLDIAGGLVGCLATLVFTVIIGPIIYIKSPGPIFFSQIRIGKNGKKFRMYKFRSMYMDAEERKKELMEQNKMKDGFMFKLDYDPRIIGCEKKDKDGNPKGIGNFIRKTSIDEFPQFWNVLKGDMSLVGTRPPTVDEWEKYELHHRARMAIKPGITGMWQVSGRSDITDFEEVVRLDTQYIEQWSIGLDLRILLKTVLSVVKNEGAV